MTNGGIIAKMSQYVDYVETFKKLEALKNNYDLPDDYDGMVEACEFVIKCMCVMIEQYMRTKDKKWLKECNNVYESKKHMVEYIADIEKAA